VIKMIMALRHGLLPPTLNVTAPSTAVDWSAGAVRLLTEPIAWPGRDGGRPRRAGVSSFGISGTNAHVIVEEPPADPVRAGGGTPAATRAPVIVGPVPLLVSARSEGALRAQAARLRDHPAAGAPPADLGFSLLTTRAALPHRAVVIGRESGELCQGLAAFADGVPGSDVVSGVVRGDGRVVFAFPGQGSQWVGMAVGLLDASPVFASSIDACGAALSQFVDWSLSGVLRAGSEAGWFDRVDVVQPVLWAVMVSLAELWRSLGVEPSAVVGHSQGEIAAACVAGALSLEDGARVVALRSKAIVALSGRGGMVSVALAVAEVEALIAPYAGRISVAALNGPMATVVSGDADALADLLAECEAAGVRARRVEVDYASHSVHVEELEAELAEVLAGIAPRTSSVPFYSTLTGGLIDTATLDAGYWYRNLRERVRFAPVVRRLLEDGFGVFIEASAHPVLTVGIAEGVEEAGAAAVSLGSLRRDDGGPERFLASAAEAWVHGVPVDWSGVFPPDAQRIDLPTHAFQHERYWLEAPPGATRSGAVEDKLDVAFWDAIEREDLDGLSALMPADDTSRTALAPALSVLSAWRRDRRERSTVDAWRYRATWKAMSEQPSVAARETADGQTWLLITPGRERGLWFDVCLEALATTGAAVEIVEIDVTTADRAAVGAALRDVETASPAGILSLLAFDERPRSDAPDVVSGLYGTVALVQAMDDLGLVARLWCVTRGAVSTGRDDRLDSPVQAQVWGLGRVAALEYPRLWGGLVDLPGMLGRPDAPGPLADDAVKSLLAGVLTGSIGEDQLAVRGAGLYMRRLIRAESGRSATPAEPPTATASQTEDRDRPTWLPDPHGTVLITGGTGALGRRIARWLAARGAGHLVLASRRGPDAPGAAEIEAELGALGATVTIARCDVADRAAVEKLLSGISSARPLNAVVHAAGVLDNDLLADADLPHLARVLGPKAAAAAHLHDLTADLPMTAFVLLSSNAGVWGSGGQGGYAAANAYLDALAEHRRSLGLPATSVAWGAWAGDGLAAEAAEKEYLDRRGVRGMAPDLALGALGRALDDDEICLTVADVDWRRFAVSFTAARPSPLLADLPEAQPAGDEAEQRPAEDTALRRRLADLAPADQHSVLVEAVRAHAAVVLGHPAPDAVAADRAFRDLGFDSLAAVQLRDRLAADLGLKLPTTLVFDHPTPDALAGHLRAGLAGDEPGEARVLAQLDRIDTVLAGPEWAEWDDGVRRRIAGRLQSLLAKSTGGGSGGAAPDGGQDAAHRELASATADEIFDLIHEELGKA
jgi:acyl transferase domain-containing protein/acyl carrier protein